MHTEPSEAFAAISDVGVRELLGGFPFPTAVVRIDTGELMTNSLFDDLVDPACLREPPLLDLVLAPDTFWHLMTLKGRSGLPIEVGARATATRFGSLLLLDSSSERTRAGEFEAMRRRMTKLEETSSTDRLTGLWNRRHFDAMVEHEIACSVRVQQPLSLISIDLDHFKSVNDRFGHAGGDDVLCAVAHTLRSEARATDLLFRWGGEEFAVLTIGSGYRTATVLAERLRSAIERTDLPHVARATASFGVAEHDASASIQRWFERADAQLYAAKAAGRNRVCVDRGESSKESPAATTPSVLHLLWHDKFACGEATVDAQHQRLFVDANHLIDSLFRPSPDSAEVARRMGLLLEGIVEHFGYEEALLVRVGYARVLEHAREHEGLLRRAVELQQSADAGNAELGPVVSFLAHEVVAKHLLVSDRDFLHLLAAPT